MKLRSLSQDTREISLGQALRLVAETGLEVLESQSPELIIMRNPVTQEYWSLENDRYQIGILTRVAKLVSGPISIDDLKEIPHEVYPDLRDRKSNKNSRKQAVVFVLRRVDYSHRIPSLDERNFWGKLEKSLNR
jgi:hypothetical protein